MNYYAQPVKVLFARHQGLSPTSTGGDIYLERFYTLLTPMRRFRRDYDLQSSLGTYGVP